MYVADDLKRLNDKAIKGLEDRDTYCDYCDKPAVEHIPVYNPADDVRGVTGAYGVVSVCNEHLYNDDWKYDGDEYFDCPYCGRFFVSHHSWDILAVMTDDVGYVCQKCYIDNELESLPLWEVYDKLSEGDTSDWKRLNAIPDRELIWEGEYSGWSDFPGHTSLKTVLAEIEESAREAGYEEGDHVYVVISHGYQFSVVLAVYGAE